MYRKMNGTLQGTMLENRKMVTKNNKMAWRSYISFVCPNYDKMYGTKEGVFVI